VKQAIIRLRKSRFNLILEPTSTKQRGLSLFPKETTGALIFEMVKIRSNK